MLQRGVFVYDAARISARHEGKDRRGHRPRREQPSARGAAGAERCEGHRLRQEGARERSAARRRTTRRSARCCTSARVICAICDADVVFRTPGMRPDDAGAAGGEGARRGHHERDGGVLRRLSVSAFIGVTGSDGKTTTASAHCRASRGMRGGACGSAATSAVRCSRTRSR